MSVILATHAVYYYLIANYGNFLVLEKLVWSLGVSITCVS
jgi:hypothetical protein